MWVIPRIWLGCEDAWMLLVYHVKIVHSYTFQEKVKQVILTADNTTVTPVQRQFMYIYSGPSKQQQILTFQEGHPTPLKCISVGGYPPPVMSIFVGRRNITHRFQDANRTVLRGEPGLRLIELASEKWTNTFIANPGDDGRRLRCSVSVFGYLPQTTVARINVNCKHSPYWNIILYAITNWFQYNVFCCKNNRRAKHLLLPCVSFCRWTK